MNKGNRSEVLMFKGKTTNELYEKCLKAGFCKEHQKDIEVSVLGSYEVQRKAFLYLRFQIFGPLAFHKPFTFDKMKSLFTASPFGDRNDPESEAVFQEQILYLDAIVVFTICHFSKICCVGSMFQRDQHDIIKTKEGTLVNLLLKKNLHESDIGYLIPLLKENFGGDDESIYKLGYVAAMLLVRNVSLTMKLKKAIEHIDKELNNIPEECRSWLAIGSAAQAQEQYTEAINAYTSGLKYSPYCIPLLLQRADMFLITHKYKEAALDTYVILMIEPTYIPALCKYVNALYHMSLYHECLKAIEYGLEKCENSYDKQFLERMKITAKTQIEQLCPEDCLENKSLIILCQGKVEEKKDIPELIEASDSETEDQDVPELMEASNSDDSSSDSETTKTAAIVLNCTAANQSSQKEKVVDSQLYPSKVEVQKSSEETCQKAKKADTEIPKDVEEKVNQIKCLLKEASQKLLDGGDPLALRKCREALDEIKAFPETYKYKECDIVCIKYAFATSYCKSGGYDDLQRAISAFKGIAEDHSSVTFPAAYYGIALANRKLNRFKEALHYLQIVDDILENGIEVEVYSWPESTVVIEETRTENLKTLVDDLMKECENPPSPEATCRFQDCTLQPAIYYTDPDFKGFFKIQCSYQCTLQFHPFCWKLLKTEKRFSDKEFLDQKCITPDCEGVIIKIETIDKEGNLGKVFESADSKKSTKKKTKLEKKLEVKEEKRRKRKDSSSKNDVVSETTNEIQPPPDSQPENNNSDIKTEVKEKAESPSISNETQISANAELFTVLKKEKIIDENINRNNSKVKEHKKARNTLSIDEFLDRADTFMSSTNEYQQRLNTLRQNKQHVVKGQWANHNMKATAPSFEPQRVPNFAQVETAYGLEDFPQMSPTSTSATTPDTNSIGAVESMSHTFNPSSMLLPPEFSMECAKKNIYSYLKNILCKHGPLREEDPILVRELQSFPGEANALIADCGGLGKFLQQSVDFAFVGETYVCTVDQLPKAYKKISSAHISLSPAEFADNINSDSFRSYESQENYVDAFQYSLNPDAKEYSPSELVGRNSPQLISAISKLRQPLTVDEESTKESNSCSLDDENATGDYCSPSVPSGVSYSASLSGETLKAPTKLQLARKCAEAVKVYFSPDANEYRSYIRHFLQPYAIMEVGQKSNVHVQTENEMEKLLKNTMKTDEELQRLKEVINCLTEENVSLKEQNELLGEQCTSALDNVTKCQRKSSVEMIHLKKELEDANLALEEQMKDSKSRESKLEKDIKVISESLKKCKEEQSTQNSEMEDLQATDKNLKRSLAQTEERVNLLRNEKHILKITLDIQINKLKDSIKNIEGNKGNILKRAEAAELKLLHVQKTEYLKKVDAKAAEAVKRMKELQEGISVANLNPVFVKNFGALLSQIQNYVAKLGSIRIEFSAIVDEQINSIKNGTPLEELKSLEMKELPEIPSWTTQLQMQNGTPSNSPSWISQVQMLTSTFNPNPANAFLRPPITSLPPNFPQMQANQQAFLQRFAHLNSSTINQGAIPKLNANQAVLTASGSQNAKKLPPGLPNPLPNFKPTPEIIQLAKQSAAVVTQPPSPMRQPSPVVTQPPSPMRQPSPVVSQPTVSQPPSVTLPHKKETTKAKSSSLGLEFIGASSLSLGSLASKSSLDVKKACDNYDSLELDYNVRNTPPPKTTIVPESSASSSKSISLKNSYEKLIQRLRVVYPEATQAQMAAIIKDYRSQKSSLSGLTIDMIINEIVAMVDAKKKYESKRSEFLQKRMMPNKPLVNKKLASNDGEPKDTEQSANPKKSVWGVSEDSSRQWQGKGIEEACTICFEEMTPQTAYRVDCGHTFHLTCIKEWMNKKSDCPICRVHLLLPEDYPTL